MAYEGTIFSRNRLAQGDGKDLCNGLEKNISAVIDNIAQSFGDYLGRMRRSRSVTLGAVARQSGINKSTLSRWEAGTHTPRITELKRVLDALGASVAEQVVALRLIDAPRAVVAVRSQDAAAMPLSLGDLLYGLRQRTGKSQADVARAVGVSRPLYSHWEADTHAPAPRNCMRQGSR